MATIKDIAKKAGVSVTTVSRALNDYDDVNIDTKLHIKKVAKELNYVPNKAARSLVMKESKNLAYILSGLEKEGGKDNIVYRILSGMFKFASTVDYEVTLYTTDTAHQKKKSYLDFCRENNISGVVINGIKLDDPYLQEIMESDIPCVLIDLVLNSDNVTSISINNMQAAYDAVEMIIKNNHKKIAFVNGRREADVAIKRLEGYKLALEAYHIPYNEDYVVYGDFLESKSYTEIYRLLLEHKEITALFCASDMMALSAVKVANDLGLKVPEDLSIMGFDDIPFAAYLNPPLATVKQDFYLMGYYAGKQLLQMIKNERVEKNVYIEHKVLARGTIGML